MINFEDIVSKEDLIDLNDKFSFKTELDRFIKNNYNNISFNSFIKKRIINKTHYNRDEILFIFQYCAKHPDFFDEFLNIVKTDIIKSIDFPNLLFHKYEKNHFKIDEFIDILNNCKNLQKININFEYINFENITYYDYMFHYIPEDQESLDLDYIGISKLEHFFDNNFKNVIYHYYKDYKDNNGRFDNLDEYLLGNLNKIEYYYYLNLLNIYCNKYTFNIVLNKNINISNNLKLFIYNNKIYKVNVSIHYGWISDEQLSINDKLNFIFNDIQPLCFNLYISNRFYYYNDRIWGIQLTVIQTLIKLLKKNNYLNKFSVIYDKNRGPRKYRELLFKEINKLINISLNIKSLYKIKIPLLNDENYNLLYNINNIIELTIIFLDISDINNFKRFINMLKTYNL